MCGTHIKMNLRHFLILFWLIWSSSSAQELHYDHFTVRDGLLQMQVTTLFQDSKGHLWIGTKLGASRFDGTRFTNFTIKDGLPESFVHNISEDSAGRILLLTRSGLAIFDSLGLRSYPTDLFLTCKGLYDPIVKGRDSIFIVKANINNQLELYHFDGSYYTLKEQYFQPTTYSSINSELRVFYDYESNTLYAGSGIVGLNAIRSGNIKKIADIKLGLQSFSRGHDGQIYVCMDAYFGIIKGDSLHWRSEDVIKITSSLFLDSFTVDKDGRIIFRENDSQRLVILDKGQLFREQFNHGIITRLLLDREGCIWIGTEKGLYRNNTRAILNFLPSSKGINEHIWSISEDKNHKILFFSLDQGIQSYANGIFQKISGYSAFTHPEHKPLFYMGSYRNKAGDVFVPVTYPAVLRYDGEQFHKVLKNPEESVALYVYGNPDDETIWIGTNIGLYASDGKADRFYRFRPGNGRSISIVSVVKDKTGRIWAGGFNGMSYVENNEIHHLPNAGLSFPHGGNALLRDSLDNIWIGNPHGLFFYDYQTFHTIEHPLLNKLVLSLAMVGDSALLIGTISDLLMMDVKTYYQKGVVKIMHIGRDKGYHAIEPGQNGFYRDTKGYYWLTNSDRVIRIDLSQLSTNSVPPTIYISSVSLLDDRMRWNPLEKKQMNEPVFRYDKNEKNLRFEITAISLRDPLGVVYSHFLEGYDKGWSEPENINSVSYTNLSPGKYTLYFKAANTDGVWSDEASFSFVIRPAFYQTIWFEVLVTILLAAALIFAGIIANNRRRKKQALQLENEKKIAQLKLISLKNQIDPHFTYNAMNTIASAIMKDEKDIAYRFFVRLSRLMRSIMNTSEKLSCNLESELEFVKDFLEIQQFRFKEQFDYSIVLEEGVNLNWELPKMTIQTFVENALKHGLMQQPIEGRVDIRISEGGDFFFIEIKDNGIGRERARQMPSQSTGKGLIILKGYFDFFNRYNYQKMHWEITDLKNEAGQAAGTLVSIVMPKTFKYNTSPDV